MATKEERQAEAHKHTGLVRGVFESEIAAAIASATIYEDGAGRDLDLPEPRFDATKAVTAWEPLQRSILHGKGKVCVVDPCSYTRPGGNYLEGGWSPECQICAESDLFPVLEGLRDAFYEGNRKASHGGLYSDRAAYLTDIAFTTDGTLKQRDILAIAPPNRRMALENHRSEAECDIDLRNRVQALMNIAAVNQPDTLILGAFGCGAMDNNAHKVAGLFEDWLKEHPGQFETVVFSIAGGPALDVFRNIFPEAEDDEPEIEAEAAEDEEEDESVDVAPVSDGRWVFE